MPVEAGIAEEKQVCLWGGGVAWVAWMSGVVCVRGVCLHVRG